MNNHEFRSKILTLLQKNARMSNEEIALRLNSEAAAIENEIKAMEKEGIILGYHAMINEDRWDSGHVRAMIEIEVQPEREHGYDEIAETICKFPEVRTVYLISGNRDLRIEVIGQSLRDVAMFVSNKLAPLPGIRSTGTHFFLKTYKEYGFTSQKEEIHERLQIAP